MNEKTAMLWQMMQSMQNQEDNNECPLPWPMDALLTLRPFMPPRQQLFIDLLIKMMEVKQIMEAMNTETAML